MRASEFNVSKFIFILCFKVFLLYAQRELALNAINKNVRLLFGLVAKFLLLLPTMLLVSFLLSLLRLLLNMAIVDLYFSLLMFVPNNILLLVFSTPPHHLYYFELFHRACKHLLLFQNIAELLTRHIGPHQIYHCAKVVKLSPALIIVIFIKGQCILKDLSSALRGPIGNKN